MRESRTQRLKDGSVGKGDALSSGAKSFLRGSVGPEPAPSTPVSSSWDGTVISVFQRREWRLRGTFWSPPGRAVEPRKTLKSANWLRMLGKWLVLSKLLFPYLSNGNRNWTCPLGRLRAFCKRSRSQRLAQGGGGFWYILPEVAGSDFISLFLTQREKQAEGKSVPLLWVQTGRPFRDRLGGKI